MSELSRKADQYWRSRTINEAQLQGYTGLRLTCGCGRITDYPFTLLLQRRSVARHNFIGNIRFRCKDCGGKGRCDSCPGLRFRNRDNEWARSGSARQSFSLQIYAASGRPRSIASISARTEGWLMAQDSPLYGLAGCE